MKHLLFVFLTLLMLDTKAQESFGIELTEIAISNSPSIQSFVWAKHDKKVLLIGGRTDGLHKRRPFESFLASGNNTMIYVLDLANKSISSAQLSVLNVGLNEQLQSTNMSFEQVGDDLFIVGGYAYSNTAADHVTFDKLTVVSVPDVINAIENNQPIDPYFEQITDTLFQVTGGYMDYLDGRFYLVGGQNFEGRYNPMGPNHGPGFAQEYTNQIRSFTLKNGSMGYQLDSVRVWTDNPILHRRDYNLAPQRFPNGELGFTAFSGVFQIGVDRPWLDVVDIHSDTFFLREGNQQLLNQYHTAHLPIYDEISGENHTIFFGGMAQFYPNLSGTLTEDGNVPFVKTISQVTRTANDSLYELSYSLQMPSYLGSGAEFIPVNDTNYFDEYEMLQLHKLPNEKVLVGYILGGIESSAPNVFFSNSPNVSWASSKLFEVYLDKTSTGAESWTAVDAPSEIDFDIYPNPAQKELNIDLDLPKGNGGVTLRLLSIDGSSIIVKREIKPFEKQLIIDVSGISQGVYLLEVSHQGERKSKKVVLSRP